MRTGTTYCDGQIANRIFLNDSQFSIDSNFTISLVLGIGWELLYMIRLTVKYTMLNHSFFSVSFECKFDLCDRDLCVTQRLLELVCFHLETLKRLSIFRNGPRNNVRGVCVFLKLFTITIVVHATSRTRPFTVEERVDPPSPRRRKALGTRLLRTLLLNASEHKTQSIHNVRNKVWAFSISPWYTSKQSDIVFCEAKRGRQQRIQLQLETQESHVTEKSAIT